MLLEFSYENFLSFKNKVTFSMVATTLRDRKVKAEECTFAVGDEIKLSLCKAAAVFGANASGKSNFVKALSFYKWFILNSSKDLQSGEEIPVKPFALSSDTKVVPSMFEAVICIEDNFYRFGFEADGTSVVSEWLYVRSSKKRSKEIELFYRNGLKCEIHQRFGIGKELTDKGMLRSNALLLSLAGQFNEPTAVSIMRWLVDTTIITGSSEKEAWDWAVSKLDEEKVRRKIVAFSRYADLGMEDITKSDAGVLSSHTSYDENGNPIGHAVFPMRETESDGTIKYFSLAFPIIDALENGKRLIVDEFGAKLHTLLIERIVSLFNSENANRSKAQLVVTLHDTNLLGSNILRRDQIWFTRKDGYGACSMYALSDYKVRNDASYEKDYLLGKYGATPIMDDLSKVLEKDERKI